MLTDLLPRAECAECRTCCVFDRSDVWEMPLISPDTARRLEKDFPQVELASKNENSQYKSFKPYFDGEGLYACPLLTEKGCALGTDKPFDCRIWPFRVMKKGKLLLLTLSPVCEYVSALPADKIAAFAPSVSEAAFEEAKNRLDTVIDYIDGYPVFAVKEL